MTPLKPTPELLAAARRIATRQWTLGPNDSYDPGADPHLYLLWQHGLVYQHFAAPWRQQDGTDEDGWRLMPVGREWLAQHSGGAAL